VGEVGLDRRARAIDDQTRVFRSVIDAIAGVPVIVSVHGAGCTDIVVDLVSGASHRGIVLHWFLGDEDSVRRGRWRHQHSHASLIYPWDTDGVTRDGDACLAQSCPGVSATASHVGENATKPDE
jgi:TatD related DNase